MNLDQSEFEENAFQGRRIYLPATLYYNHWKTNRHQLYERNRVMIDMRAFDPDGTLKIDQAMNPNTRKQEPMIQFHQGLVFAELRRES